MDAPITYPIDLQVDGEVDMIVRMAAWIGAASGSETFCSFTSVLLALLRIDGYAGDFARGIGVDFAAIRSHRRIDEAGVEQALRQAQEGGLPEGKPMFSTSARNMLQEAETSAREGGAEVIGAHHLLLAYVFRTPRAHLDQMNLWRFDLATAQREVDRSPRSPPTEAVRQAEAGAQAETVAVTPPPRVPGNVLTAYRFSNGALFTFRTAVDLAARRRPPHNFIGSGTLLSALIGCLRSQATDEGVDVAGLSGLFPEALPFTKAPPGQLAPQPFRPGETLPELSPNVDAILKLADRIARMTRPDDAGTIALRHLVAGLFLHRDTPPTNAHRQLVDAGVDIAAQLNALAGYLNQTWPADNQGVWAEALLGLPIPSPGPATSLERTIPSPGPAILVSTFDTDNPLAQASDLLDVAEEAKAFARLVASRRVDPPLSIGIFGDWGAGKTFFMERLQEHVEELASRLGVDDGVGMFHKGIVQIRFNAWHYIETNLWASLVEFIFDELDRWLRPRRAATDIEALFDKLATSRQLKLEALQELVFTRQQREAAKVRLADAKAAHETAVLRHTSASPRAFWQAVAQTFVAQFSTTTEGEGAVRALNKASERLGLPALQEAGGELRIALREAETQAGRAKLVSRGLLQAMGTRWWWWMSAALLLFVAPACLVAITVWLGSIPSLAWFKEIGSATTGLSSILAVIAACLGWATQRAKGALDTLEKFRGELDAAILKETNKPENDFAQAEREVAISQAAVAQAEEQYAQAEQRVCEAKRELESGTARGRLNQFIRDKVVAGDYARHLGIVATIRKDFGQLARIMDDAKDDRAQAESERLEKEHQDRVTAFLGQHGQYLEKDEIKALQENTDEEELRLFRRIILYIDDLDRCPPAKVIEVLQAIHLLLYFNLFVVVVAVDARWVSRALMERYRGLLDDETSRSRKRPAAPASAYDYLEKIFQIPYWVRPMEGEASQAFVESLVGVDVREAMSPEHEPSPPLRPEPEYSPPLPPELRLPPADPQPSLPLPPGPTPLPLELAPQPPPQPGMVAADPPPETLTLSPWEAKLMRRLAPYLGQSPRRAKRFVNVYRLVKTGLPRSQAETLVGPKGLSHGYRALLTQLAIVTGAPRTASLYFAALSSGNSDETLETLGQRLELDAGLTGSADWNIIRGALTAVLEFSNEHGGDIGTALVAEMRDVVRVTSRYSFLRR